MIRQNDPTRALNPGVFETAVAEDTLTLDPVDTLRHAVLQPNLSLRGFELNVGLSSLSLNFFSSSPISKSVFQWLAFLSMSNIIEPTM